MDSAFSWEQKKTRVWEICFHIKIVIKFRYEFSLCRNMFNELCERSWCNVGFNLTV